MYVLRLHVGAAGFIGMVVLQPLCSSSCMPAWSDCKNRMRFPDYFVIS